jgi:hypothetical protein
MKSSTVWTFCELQMAFKCRGIEHDEFFQVEQINSLLSRTLCFCVYLKYGGKTVAMLYNYFLKKSKFPLRKQSSEYNAQVFPTVQTYHPLYTSSSKVR